MAIGVIGGGLVGRRVAAALSGPGREVVLMARRAPTDVAEGVRVIGSIDVRALAGCSTVVLATESTHQRACAEALIAMGVSVVATADRPKAVRAMWDLGPVAERTGAALVVGAGHSPGLTSLLAAHLVARFDEVSTITTARFGTGGPTCAREHHRSMAASAWEIRDGIGRSIRGGSGRTLVWFPEPVGGQDCYRAGLVEPFLLQQAFPHVDRIQSLQAATRRDRLTARLPMLRPPHAEGLEGAAWAEVRGRIDGVVHHESMAALAPQATGAAAVASTVAASVAAGRVMAGVSTPAMHVDVAQTLASMAPDVRLLAYAGNLAVREGENAPIRAARKWRLPGETPEIIPKEVD